MRHLLLLSLLFASAAPSYAQQIHYVNAAASGQNDGSSWENAFIYLQDALTVALAGDEIWVAKGIYRPDQGIGMTEEDRKACFFLSPGIALYGGYAGNEENRSQRDWNANESILSGDLLGNDSEHIALNEPTRQDNSHHVVCVSNLDSNTTLDGFTVSNGHAVSDDDSVAQVGGGLWTAYSDQQVGAMQARFAHLKFEENTALVGGGVFIDRVDGIEFVDVTFRNNVAEEGGGAYVQGSMLASGGMAEKMKPQEDVSLNANLATFSLSKGRIIDNQAGVGGGLFFKGGRIQMRDIILEGNVASAWAGGLHLDKATLVFGNGLFAGNQTLRFEGGAMVVNEGEAQVINVVFSGNQSAQDGGALANEAGQLQLVNVTLTNNRSGRRGGAIYNNANDKIVITNTVLWGNIASQDGQELYNVGNSEALVQYSLIADSLPRGTEDGGGNFTADPLFLDPVGIDGIVGTLDDNVRLQMNSPAIDTGNNQLLPADTLDLDEDGNLVEHIPIDLDGHQRIHDGGSGALTVDLGAYEFDALKTGTATERRISHLEVGIKVYPNPFRDRARVIIQVPSAGYRQIQISLKLYDPLGRVVDTIYQGQVATNQRQYFEIETTGLSNGIYFLRGISEGFSAKGIPVFVNK